MLDPLEMCAALGDVDPAISDVSDYLRARLVQKSAALGELAKDVRKGLEARRTPALYADALERTSVELGELANEKSGGRALMLLGKLVEGLAVFDGTDLEASVRDRAMLDQLRAHLRE